jgi:hypothetical protein
MAMARICDRSPCDSLLKALGNWVFGTHEGFFVTVASQDKDKDSDEPIDYCPFCGTRLEEVGPMLIEKFMRPRKRRRVMKMATS